LSVYLDANVLISAFHADAHSEAAYSLLAREAETFVSDIAAAELVAVFGRLARMRRITESHALDAITDFDAWRSGAPLGVETEAADVALADRFLRRMDLNLRLPDALHIAIARRIGARLATFDVRMAEAARILGVELAPL